MPQTPEDCINIVVLQFLLPSTGRPFSWYFDCDGETKEFEFQAAVSITDDVLGNMTLAKNGGGICQSFHYIVADDLKQRPLGQILKRLHRPNSPYSMVYLPNRMMSATVRAFVDFVMEIAEKATHQARPLEPIDFAVRIFANCPVLAPAGPSDSLLDFFAKRHGYRDGVAI